VYSVLRTWRQAQAKQGTRVSRLYAMRQSTPMQMDIKSPFLPRQAELKQLCRHEQRAHDILPPWICRTKLANHRAMIKCKYTVVSLRSLAAGASSDAVVKSTANYENRVNSLENRYLTTPPPKVINIVQSFLSQFARNTIPSFA
jgi:hypothetical protein